MSPRALDWVWANRGLAPRLRLVLLALAAHADAHGESWVASLGQLERMTCLSRRGSDQGPHGPRSRRRDRASRRPEWDAAALASADADGGRCPLWGTDRYRQAQAGDAPVRATGTRGRPSGRVVRRASQRLAGVG
jgi:hypothetical protein